MSAKLIEFFDEHFLNEVLVTSLFIILIFFTDFNALSLRRKFWCLVYKHDKMKSFHVKMHHVSYDNVRYIFMSRVAFVKGL